MRKKRVLTMVTAAALTAVVCVGGTLAYLSTTSNTVTNTVTVGKGYEDDDDDHHGLFIDETGYVYNEETKKNELTGSRTEIGNKYENLLPADHFTKDPKVTMIGGSVASYVFVKVENVDSLENIKVDDAAVFDIKDWNTGSTGAWLKLDENGDAAAVQEGDGFYVYQGNSAENNVVDVSLETVGDHVQLPEAIFGTIAVNDVDEMPAQAEVAANEVKVTAYAVQTAADPQGYKLAFEEIKNK